MKREDVIPKEFQRNILNEAVKILGKAENLKKEDHSCEHLFLGEKKPTTLFLDLKMKELKDKASLLKEKDIQGCTAALS